MPIDINFNPCQGHVTQNSAYLNFQPAAPLSHWVQSFWQLNVPAGHYGYRSMPDNCLDLIINAQNPLDVFIVSPFSAATEFDVLGPVSYFGIRFRVLGHQGLIATPVGEWRDDETVQVTDLMAGPVLDKIVECFSKSLPFNIRCKNVSTILLANMVYPKVDARLARYIRFCHSHTASSMRISEKQCRDFGLSARQLRRLSHQYLGLSPRELARVFRFQAMLKTMSNGNGKLAWADHYHDQPHFIREFKSLSGFTPNQFKRLSVLYNKD
mgnify:FL=1